MRRRRICESRAPLRPSRPLPCTGFSHRLIYWPPSQNIIRKPNCARTSSAPPLPLLPAPTLGGFSSLPGPLCEGRGVARFTAAKVRRAAARLICAACKLSGRSTRAVINGGPNSRIYGGETRGPNFLSAQAPLRRPTAQRRGPPFNLGHMTSHR